MSFQSFECHSIIPMSFHHSNFIPPFQCHSSHLNVIPVIWMSFHHSSVIPLILVHADNIPSFGCHSIHSMVIRALEWREMTSLWNDRNDVGMTISVIPSTFRHPLSSQMAWKNGAILDFIPVIPDESCHSMSFKNSETMWISSNDVGMTEDDELKWTSFPSLFVCKLLC